VIIISCRQTIHPDNIQMSLQYSTVYFISQCCH
jgi:hypothetical protein